MDYFFFFHFGCTGSSSLCAFFVCVCGGNGEWGLLYVTVSGLLVVVASRVSEHRL